MDDIGLVAFMTIEWYVVDEVGMKNVVEFGVCTFGLRHSILLQLNKWKLRTKPLFVASIIKWGSC